MRVQPGRVFWSGAAARQQTATERATDDGGRCCSRVPATEGAAVFSALTCGVHIGAETKQQACMPLHAASRQQRCLALEFLDAGMRPARMSDQLARPAAMCMSVDVRRQWWRTGAAARCQRRWPRRCLAALVSLCCWFCARRLGPPTCGSWKPAGAASWQRKAGVSQAH